MKSQSSSSATLKFSSPEINVGLDAAKGKMPSPAKKPKMPTGGKTPKMPKNSMVVVAQSKRKRMPKRNKM
jgi:hypothetical protein